MVQPEPLPVTVSEYVAVAVGVASGFCTVVDDRFGPLHVQPTTAMLVLALRVAEPPRHIGPLLVTPDDAGTGFTETVVVYTVGLLQPGPVPKTVSE